MAIVSGVIMVADFNNEYTYKKYVESGKEEEFDRLFEEAVVAVKNGLGKKHPMYIGGKETFSNEILEERSPIDSTIIIGHFQKGSREHARMAISAAKNAFKSWKSVDYKERVALLRKAADAIRKDKFRIGAILSIENGKTRYESVGEVDEAIDFINYYCDEMERNKGYMRRTRILGSKGSDLGFQGAPGSGEKISIHMKPYGVFGVIAPFNFPISISVGMSVGAIITGNTVVFKPSSTDNMAMLTGVEIYNVFKKAGLPDGVFNLVTGPGSEVGDEIVNSDDVAGIAFTGSRSTGMGMMEKSINSKTQKVFVVEMGGKNPTIISKHADMESSVSGVVSAAFGYSGQKCSALSRIYIHKSIKEEFVSLLIDRTRKLNIGDPLNKKNYVGPLISEGAYKRYMESIERAKSTGKVLCGGNRFKCVEDGYYVEPAIVEVRKDDELMHKELFVPILAMTTYEDISEALTAANDTEYGLCAGLYSKNRREIKLFSESIEAGVVYINRPTSATTGAIVGHHTFVGWKGSGISGKGTGSKSYLQLFMREQSLSITG